MNYRINEPAVISESLDGECVIINTLSGRYFTARGHGLAIWEALVAGVPADAIVAAYAQAGLFADRPDAVMSLVEQALAEDLLVPSPAQAPSNALFTVDPSLPEQPPTLACHDDLQALIELDPIHEVSPQKGWPFR